MARTPRCNASSGRKRELSASFAASPTAMAEAPKTDGPLNRECNVDFLAITRVTEPNCYASDRGPLG
jgi:hypothetical protein